MLFPSCFYKIDFFDENLEPKLTFWLPDPLGTAFDLVWIVCNRSFLSCRSGMLFRCLASAEIFQNYQGMLYETRVSSRGFSGLLADWDRQSKLDKYAPSLSSFDQDTFSRCPSTAPEPMAILVFRQVQVSVQEKGVWRNSFSFFRCLNVILRPWHSAVPEDYPPLIATVQHSKGFLVTRFGQMFSCFTMIDNY